jgi:hypothetical protein
LEQNLLICVLYDNIRRSFEACAPKLHNTRKPVSPRWHGDPGPGHDTLVEAKRAAVLRFESNHHGSGHLFVMADHSADVNRQ